MQTGVYQPTISVITICYNAGAHLRLTVASVCTQDYPNIEYIIIDGASTDGSLDTICEYRDRISKIVSEKDKGIYDAMNKGLHLATGEYICYMNAGDTFYSPDTLSKAFGSIGTTRPDVIYGQTDIVDSQFRFVRHRRLEAPHKLTYKSFKHGMVVCHQSFYARRALAPDFDLSYRFSADVDWCIKILKRSKHNHYTGLTLTNYLEEGATTKNRMKSLKERYAIMSKHYGMIQTFFLHLYFVVRSFWRK